VTIFAPLAMQGTRRLVPRGALALAMLAASSVALAEGTLEVKGSLVAGRTFTLRDFAALPHTELMETHGVGAPGGQESLQVKWGGVLLRDVLAAADFREMEQRDFRRTLIVARASDGYVALFTWGELFNTKAGDSILVITSKDGKALQESEGPYALRALGDIKPGPRHVRWLQQLEVSTIQQ
jgi:DMSO/TMAO reductase YedYZ molybdopterin-dependent catalytic subunit